MRYQAFHLSWKNPFDKLEKSISTGKFHFNWKIPFQLEKSISTGKVNFNWKSQFQLEKYISTGKVHFNWKSLFQPEMSILIEHLKSSHLRSIYLRSSHLRSNHNAVAKNKQLQIFFTQFKNAKTISQEIKTSVAMKVYPKIDY